MPKLRAVTIVDVPQWFVAYDAIVPMHRRGALPADVGCHFFTDDYRFESAWNNPQRALARMPGCIATCSPDFSLFRDWPLAMQLWNVYRSRLLGALWSRSLTVIPTVGWSDRSSFSFCFDGLPQESVLAISTVGTQGADKESTELFLAGYEAMLAALSPCLMLVHGEKVPDEIAAMGVPIRQIPTWQQLMRRRVEPSRFSAD